jgi:hypothetical protein
VLGLALGGMFCARAALDPAPAPAPAPATTAPPALSAPTFPGWVFDGTAYKSHDDFDWRLLYDTRLDAPKQAPFAGSSGAVVPLKAPLLHEVWKRAVAEWS